MSSSFDLMVDKAFRGTTAEQLAAASPAALNGVTDNDASKLDEAFGITSIREFAENVYARRAAAIAAAASDRPSYDPGPPGVWEKKFANAPLDTYLGRPDLFRVDFGPVFYRGRLDGTARVLVVGQDPSVNELLAQRVFVGQSGQRLQGFLSKLGLDRSYVMVNTFLFSIFGQFGGERAALSAQDPILGFRNDVLDALADSNPLQAVLTVGSAARDAIDRWPGIGDLPRVHILHPAFPDIADVLANWNNGLDLLRPIVEPDDGAEAQPDYGSALADGDVVAIPRRDLPFGLPGWHGDGDHAKRQGNDVIEWHSSPVP